MQDRSGKLFISCLLSRLLQGLHLKQRQTALVDRADLCIAFVFGLNGSDLKEIMPVVVNAPFL